MDSPEDANWIALPHLQHFVAQGQSAGVDVSRLLKASGLEPLPLGQADSRVPLAALELALAQLIQEMPDTLLGLRMASNIQPATFGVLGFLTQACARFADVLDLMVRYNGLLSSFGHTRICHAPGKVEVIWQCCAGGALFRRHASEYVLGSIVTLGRALVPSGSLKLLAVSFPHAPPPTPGSMTQYQNLFRAPVYFNAPQASLTLDARQLHESLHHGDAEIRKTLQRHADEMLQRRQQRPALREDVLRLMEAVLGERVPGMEEVARQLGLSARSLHRKLAQEGVHFRTLLDQVRLRRAMMFLCEGDEPLDALADQLGFQSHQSLIRWFRDKTGCTPGQYRTEQRHTEQGACDDT